MTEAVELKLDEENQLFFKVQIEGTQLAPVAVRLVCEAEGLAYTFKGHYNKGGEVQVDVPSLGKTKTLEEGKHYEAKLEVMIENRYFVPLKFDVKFKESVKVVAEMVSAKSGTVTEAASPVTVKQPNKVVVTAEMLQKAIKPASPVAPAKPVVKQPATLREKFGKK